MSYFKLSLLILIAAAAVINAAEGDPNAVNYAVTEIEFEKLHYILYNRNNVIYLDVRNRDDVVAEGKIVGSLNIPLLELERAFGLLSDEEFLAEYNFAKPVKKYNSIVIGSKYPSRNEMAVEILGKLGYKLLIYVGGITDWVANDGPITKVKSNNSSKYLQST